MSTSPDPSQASLSERLSKGLSEFGPSDLSPKAKLVVESEFIEVLGLVIAARKSDYLSSLIASLNGQGNCTVPGQDRGFEPSEAALVSGVAIHGEDFDDTLEGAPIRVAPMVFPNLLAAGESRGLSGQNVFLGATAGMEAICWINRLAPSLMQSRGFHPVGVIGHFGSAAAVSRALDLFPGTMASAMGLSGSFSSGILEYLGEGAWTKRLHPGLASQSGYRAARLAAQGFVAPRFVFEGRHGLYKAFAGLDSLDQSLLLAGLGQKW
ncbi:MAG: MmgE/PrpD family protein [Deltaproteobacteria bacterium]|jgi:2-methylcitrate dehydratase PrpD|nr:MmgE/PrpD family protein [Deltaproteobacteria bacterium]